MPDTNISTNTKRPPQKPVFIIDPFDKTKEDHLKGMISIRMNRKQATDLCRLIQECELGQEEGHLYAMQGNIRRWYDKRRKESQTPTVIQTDKLGA